MDDALPLLAKLLFLIEPRPNAEFEKVPTRNIGELQVVQTRYKGLALHAPSSAQRPLDPVPQIPACEGLIGLRRVKENQPMPDRSNMGCLLVLPPPDKILDCKHSGGRVFHR